MLVRSKDGEKRQVLTLLLQEKLNPADHNREIFIQVLKYVFFLQFYLISSHKKGYMGDQIGNYMYTSNIILKINKVYIFQYFFEYGLSFYIRM